MLGSQPERERSEETAAGSAVWCVVRRSRHGVVRWSRSELGREACEVELEGEAGFESGSELSGSSST